MHHPKSILLLTLIFSMGLLISTPSQAQFGGLKKGLKKKLQRNKRRKTTGTSKRNNNRRRTTTSSGRRSSPKMPNGMTVQLAKEYKAYYKAKYELSANNWYHPTNANSKFMAEKLPSLRELNYPELKQRMNTDKGKFPKMFVKYGYGNSSASAVNPDLYWANHYVMKITDWEQQVANEEKYMPGAVQYYITESEKNQGPDKMELAQKAIDLADVLLLMKPQNDLLKEYKKEATQALDKSLTNFREYITSDFHKNHMRKIVVFSKGPQNIGKNAMGRPKFNVDKSSVIHTIIPGKPAHVIGFFAATNKQGGGIPSLVFKMAKVGEKFNKHLKNTQTMYFRAQDKSKLKDQAFYMFNLFPDPNIQYKSHVAYIPHLNFAKYLLRQVPGKYNIEFTWGRNNPMARGTFTLDLSIENREKLKDYYQKLMATKIAAVTIPQSGKCVDQAHMVVNKDHLNKYGKRLKLVLTGPGGKIMHPWPNDHKVKWYTNQGYGIFEKTDGKVEIIHLAFRRVPSAQRWMFAAIGKTGGHLALSTPDGGVKPEMLTFGYEMKKANVNKCVPWF